MKLVDWMNKNNFKLEEFAKIAGVTPSYIWKLRSFKVCPSLLLARVIVTLTGGEVGYDDLLMEDAPKRKREQIAKIRQRSKERSKPCIDRRLYQARIENDALVKDFIEKK